MKIAIQLFVIIWVAFASWGMAVRSTDTCEELWEKFGDTGSLRYASQAIECDYQIADRELNEVYQKIIFKVTDESLFMANLRKEQKIWLKNRFEFMELMYPAEEMGREAQVIHRPLLIVTLTKARTEYLKGFLHDNRECYENC